MSLVAHYKLDETDVSIDSSVNSNNLSNFGVTSVVDATYGNVALFSGAQYFRIFSSMPAALVGSSPRTISVWLNRDNNNLHIIFDNGTVGSRNLLYFQTNDALYFLTSSVSKPTQIATFNTWIHIAMTFDGTTEKLYQDGVEIHTGPSSLNTSSSFYVGGFSNGTAFRFEGKMSDLRIYDYALDSSEMSTLFSNGPNPAPNLLSVDPRVSNILSTVVSSVPEATGYRLTYQQTGSSNEIVGTENFIGLTQTIINLIPETEYTIRLYFTEDGSVYTLIGTSTATTLVNSGSNYDKSDYLSSGRFDISTLDNTSVGLISDVMNDVFATGDIIDFNVSGKTKKSTFVNRGSSVNITDIDAVIAPFSADGTSGQTVSLTLSDTSTVSVLYNETTEAVTVDGTSHNTGDSFVLDGKKVTIVDL